MQLSALSKMHFFSSHRNVSKYEKIQIEKSHSSKALKLAQKKKKKIAQNRYKLKRTQILALNRYLNRWFPSKQVL